MATTSAKIVPVPIAELQTRQARVAALRHLAATRLAGLRTRAAEQLEAENAARQKVTNALTPDQERQIELATEQFTQSVTRVDNQIMALYIQAIQAGDYAAAEAILEGIETGVQFNTLMFALLTIGVILFPIYARQRLNALFNMFGLHAAFAQTDESQKSLRDQAEKGAKSHVKTIAKDIKNSLDEAIDEELPTVRQGMEERFPELKGKKQKDYLNDVRENKDMYKYARQLILSGASRDTIIKKLQEKFSEVSKKRAKVIANNESNRVFTLSQYEADEQFLAQNNLTGKAYKRLVSNTGTPCPICEHIIKATAAKPIPFKTDFAKFGKEMRITYTENGKKKVIKFTPNYEHLRGGHIHVNCHCRYELLIKKEDGTWLNSVDFVDKLHPRDRKGKFAKKGTATPVDFSRLGSLDKFNDFVEQNYWLGTFGDHKEDVTDAVRAYQGHYYDSINLHARNNDLKQPLMVYGEKTTYKKTVDNINAAANISLADETTLYRGTETPYHEITEVGDVIHSRSFLSTTAVKDVSDNFKSPGGSSLVITAKKGTKVILPDLVTFGKRGKTLNEAEVLIPTGASLTITRIDGDVVYAILG